MVVYRGSMRHCPLSIWFTTMPARTYLTQQRKSMTTSEIRVAFLKSPWWNSFKMKNFFSLHLDSLGFSASMLCAIHCVAVPLLLTVSTWSGLQMLNNPSIELVVLCSSAVFALFSIVPSYIRFHRNPKAIALVVLGFMLIGLGRFDVEEIWEITFTSIGAATVASAHILNWRLCKSCSKPSQK